MFKSIQIVLLLFISFHLFAQETALELWLTDYEKASEQSEENNKPILLVFSGSDWCKPCIMLEKEVFETEYFLEYAKDNLILLKADFPRRKKNRLSKNQVKHNEMLAEKYNQNGVFPLVVILDARGEIKGETGYLHGGAENYIHHIESILN